MNSQIQWPAADDSFGLVRVIWRNVGAGDSQVLVLTHPHGNLYRVDLLEGTAKLTASPGQSPDSQAAVAALGAVWASYYGSHRHDSLGFVYGLSKGAGFENDEIRTLYICDSNADGIPDDFLLLSTDLFDSLGPNDAGSWTFNEW